METAIRVFLSLFVAIMEVLLIYYFTDTFFERRLKRACIFIGAAVSIFLFLADHYFDNMWIIVGGFLAAILIIVFSSYGGFKEFLPKLLISVFIYWTFDLGETIPAMLCILIFGQSNYIDAIQNNLAFYDLAYVFGVVFSFILTYLIKRASKKRIVTFKLKYKLLLLICPTISFTVYFYWCNLIYYGIMNDYVFTLGLAASLFMVNLINIKLLNWISEDAEENAKILSVQEYLKNERKHLAKLDERDNEIRRMSHDLRHHIRSLTALISSGNDQEAVNYMKQLTDSVTVKTGITDTGNSLIDSVVEEYRTKAESKGIKIDLKINILEQLPLDEIGIVIILGNALENAIEYCILEKMYFVDVLMRSNDKFLMIEVSNPIKQHIDKTGILKSGKPDSSVHGIGIQSMRETVRAMNGDLVIECDHDKFVLTAMLPLAYKSQEATK